MVQTGLSRRHELVNLLAEPVLTVPRHSTEDGISATRGCLGVSWFDETACRKGLARLRAYRRGKGGVAVPDGAEDAADAFQDRLRRPSHDWRPLRVDLWRRRSSSSGNFVVWCDWGFDDLLAALAEPMRPIG